MVATSTVGLEGKSSHGEEFTISVSEYGRDYGRLREEEKWPQRGFAAIFGRFIS